MASSFFIKCLQKCVGNANKISDLIRPATPSTRRSLGASLSLKAHFKPGMALANEELLDLHKNILAVGKQSNIDHPICSETLDLEELRNKYSDAVIGLIYRGQKPEAFLYSPLLEFNNGNILHSGLAVSSGKTKTRAMEILGLANFDIMFRNGIFSYFITNVTCHPRGVEAFSANVFRPWPAPDANLLHPPDDYVPVFQALFQKYLRTNIQQVVPNYKRFTITSMSKNMGFKHEIHQLKTPKNLRYLTFCKSWLNYEKEEDLVQVGKFTPFHGLAASLKLGALCMVSRMKNLENPSQRWEAPPSMLALEGVSTLSRSVGTRDLSMTFIPRHSRMAKREHSCAPLKVDNAGKSCSGESRRLDYSRNWLFIDEQTQFQLAQMRVLVVGLGMGSKFAEAALRVGIQHMTLCDGDSVELSNLNRQNFEYGDIAISKVEAVRARLRKISPDLNLTVVNKFLTKDDLERLVPDHDVVINAIDFDLEEEFKHCTATVQRYGKMELFPINLGFGSALTIIDPSTPNWEEEFSDSKIPIKHQIIARLINSENTPPYLVKAGNQYFNGGEVNRNYDPQLGAATDIASSLLTTTLVRKARGEKLTLFPKFLYLDANAPQIL